MSADLENLLNRQLASLEGETRRRWLRGFGRDGNALIAPDGRRLVDFASNDYLGLAHDTRLIERACSWTARLGAGSGSSRLIAGSADEYLAVEAKLAAFKGAAAALVFSSGFQLNATVLPALIDLLRADGEVLVFADRLNHASLHHGLAAAAIQQIRFRHNDLDHLASLLAREAPKPGRRLIVTESVFSMDGDRTDLAALVDLAGRFGALIYLDEAHATGVLGPEGRGLAAALPGRIDIVMGTLGKALGGFGAYVAGSRGLIDYLITRCAGFIYSTALPPACFGALDAALDIVPSMEAERGRLHANARRLRAALKGRGLETGPSTTQIVPAILGDENAALVAQRKLESAGILAVAIRPPTVPQGQSRLRFSLSAAHGDAEMSRLIDALALLDGAP